MAGRDRCRVQRGQPVLDRGRPQLVYLGQTCRRQQLSSEVCAVRPDRRGPCAQPGRGRWPPGQRPGPAPPVRAVPLHRPGADQPGWHDDHRRRADRADAQLAWRRRYGSPGPVRDPGVEGHRTAAAAALPAVPGPDHRDQRGSRRPAAQPGRGGPALDAQRRRVRQALHRRGSTAGCATGSWCRCRRSTARRSARPGERRAPACPGKDAPPRPEGRGGARRGGLRSEAQGGVAVLLQLTGHPGDEVRRLRVQRRIHRQGPGPRRPPRRGRAPGQAPEPAPAGPPSGRTAGR